MAMLPCATRGLLAQVSSAPDASAPAASAPAPDAPAPSPPAKADEMAVNSAPQPEHYPPPDFGPPPATLPPQTEALHGANSLTQHARRRGLMAGAAVGVRDLESDPALRRLVVEQYSILVPENELKWRALRPSPTGFDFTSSDELFRFAREHDLQVRGHTLVWHNSVPDWLSRNVAQYDVRKLLVEHIRTVVGRYRGRVYSWDVVNEAILPADRLPDGLRKSFWYDAVGPDYIELAYRTAREADPHVKLAYNDYGVEYDNDDDADRRERILALVKRLRQKNVPLDAVGIQSHIKAGSTSSIGRGLSDYIHAIAAMGLEVYLTELDVNEDDLPFDDVARRDQAIAATRLSPRPIASFCV
jgi:endo-1,4-beta-xylanase